MFVFKFSWLCIPNSQIPDGPDIFFNFIEIFTDKTIVAKSAVVDNDISIIAGSNGDSNLFNGLGSKVIVTQVISDSNVLIKRAVVGLNQKHSGSENVIKQFFSENQLRSEIDLIDSRAGAS